ncbi:hypothetical protein SAMN05444920_12614 [Nonomuraea solani]|uniref:Uncharacterized protein n=1 Tax=Nonomuraea solani TaxID=1144553 RepID=A0A1H6EZG2_9ACTN|nr:hypothetical protein SAMN05444920_12614 [Nonomuraea solani]
MSLYDLQGLSPDLDASAFESLTSTICCNPSEEHSSLSPWCYESDDSGYFS